MHDITGTLVAAFVHDPLYCWLYPDPTERPHAIRANMELMLRLAAERGVVDTTDDHSAVAVWTDPGVSLLDDPQPFVDLLERWAPARVGDALGGMGACASIEPAEPHRVLHLLAVHPDRQGRGIAATLLAPTLRRGDAEGTPTYLESSNARNLSFYRRAGFAVLADVRVPGGGPVMRPMLRPVRDR